MTTDFKSIIIAFLFFFICFAETNAVKLPEKVIVTSIDPEGCTDWTYYKGECLASSGISGQNSSAGIRQKVCVLTQTATSITVEVTIEPVNGGRLGKHSEFLSKTLEEMGEVLNTETADIDW